MSRQRPNPPGFNRGDARGCELRLTPVASIPRGQPPYVVYGGRRAPPHIRQLMFVSSFSSPSFRLTRLVSVRDCCPEGQINHAASRSSDVSSPPRRSQHWRATSHAVRRRASASDARRCSPKWRSSASPDRRNDEGPTGVDIPSTPPLCFDLPPTHFAIPLDRKS